MQELPQDVIESSDGKEPASKRLRPESAAAPVPDPAAPMDTIEGPLDGPSGAVIAPTPLKYQKWGGLLAELEILPDFVSTCQDSPMLTSLMRKLDAIDASKSVLAALEVLENMQLSSHELHYLNSPLLDGLWCCVAKTIPATDSAVTFALSKSELVSITRAASPVFYPSALHFLLDRCTSIAPIESQLLVACIKHRNVELLRRVLTLIRPGRDIDGGPMKRAGEMGDPEMVELLLQFLPDIPLVSGRLAAAQHGHVSFLDVLVKHKKPIEMPAGYGHSNVFSEAAFYGQVAFGNWMLELGVDVHQLDDNALNRASQGGHVDFVRMLIAHGANVTAHGNRALAAAIKHGCLEVADVLLKAGAPMDPRNLLYAVKSNNLPLARFVLDHGADAGDLPRQYTSLLKLCVANDNLALAELLIDRGFDVRHGKGEALFLAAGLGRCNMLKLLLDRGANPSADKSNALRAAVYRNHLDALKLLLERGADPHGRKGAALCMAAELNNFEAVKILISHGAVTSAYHNFVWFLSLHPERRLLRSALEVCDPAGAAKQYSWHSDRLQQLRRTTFLLESFTSLFKEKNPKKANLAVLKSQPAAESPDGGAEAEDPSGYMTVY